MRLLDVTGGADVRNRGVNLCILLAAVPWLLYLRLSQQLDRSKQLCAAYVPGILLARYVQCNGQPSHLLLDE